MGRRGTDSDISRTHSSQPLISSCIPSFPRCRLIRSECWGLWDIYFFFIFAFSSSRLTTQHIRASFSEPDFSFFFFVGDIEMKKNLN